MSLDTLKGNIFSLMQKKKQKTACLLGCFSGNPETHIVLCNCREIKTFSDHIWQGDLSSLFADTRALYAITANSGEKRWC